MACRSSKLTTSEGWGGAPYGIPLGLRFQYQLLPFDQFRDEPLVLQYKVVAIEVVVAATVSTAARASFWMRFILIESGFVGGVENADTNGEATKTTFVIGMFKHSVPRYPACLFAANSPFKRHSA